MKDLFGSENKILHLNLKKMWFDLILCGEKKEEYREIKIYWLKRFLKTPTMEINGDKRP